jgi:hypothetical protein
MKRLAFALALAGGAATLVACSSVGVGVSIPIGGIGSIGVGASSDGRVSGGVAVGRGGVSVGVGGSGRLPQRSEPAASAAAASPAASAASAAR